MGQEFVVPSFNTNRYYNKNTENIAVLPTGLTAGMVIYVQSDGTLDGSLNHFWDNTNNRLGIGTATPGTILHVKGTGATNITIDSSGANTLDRGIRFTNADGADAAYLVVVPNTVGTDTQMQMYVGGASAGDIKMRINDTGQITVGDGASATFNDIFTITRSSGSNSTGGLYLVNSASGGYGSAINWGLNVAGASPNVYTAARLDVQNTSGSGGGYLAMSAAGVNATTLAEVARLYNDTFLIGRTSGTLSDGILQVRAAASASAAETIARFDVSDDAIGKVELSNDSGSAGAFCPLFAGTTGGANQGMVINGRITTDTGLLAALYFRADTSAAALVATRPAFIWQNNSTNVMTLTGSTAGGTLIIGGNTTVPYASSGIMLELNKVSALSGAGFNTWSADGTGGIIEFNKSRSATVGTQTIVVSGDDIGRVTFRASDGTNFITAATITGEVDGTPGTNDMPGRMVFSTTLDGSSSPTEALRISSRQNTLINLGAIAEPSTSIGTLVLTNTATAPTTSVDVVSLFADNITASGNASLAIFSEQAVAADVAVASTHSLTITINGTEYRMLLTAV